MTLVEGVCPFEGEMQGIGMEEGDDLLDALSLMLYNEANQ